MIHTRPPEMAFREALEARTFWRDAVLNDPELGFLMLDEDGVVLSANDNAADVLLGATVDALMGRQLGEALPERIAEERIGFVSYVLNSERWLLVNSVFRGVRCRCVIRRLPGDAGRAGNVLWTTRRAPIAYQPTDLHAVIDCVEARALDWGPLEALDDEERLLLGVLASGVSIQDAGTQLDWREHAVAHRRQAIIRKLGTECPMRLSQLALAAGLVELRPLVLDAC
jgi:hypothetical protein